MSIQAIETRYAGCRFRSRLEARWAVFFDHLDIRWEYEPQGFQIDGRPYLPDFRLTDSGTWIEVKGREGDLDRRFMEAVAYDLPAAEPNFPTLLIVGPIPSPPPLKQGIYGWAWIGFEWLPNEGDYIHFAPHDAHWSFTPTSFAGHPLRRADTSTATNVAVGEGPWLEPTGDLATTVNSGNIELEAEAYRSARSARFEHGEAG